MKILLSIILLLMFWGYANSHVSQNIDSIQYIVKSIKKGNGYSLKMYRNNLRAEVDTIIIGSFKKGQLRKIYFKYNNGLKGILEARFFISNSTLIAVEERSWDLNCACGPGNPVGYYAAKYYFAGDSLISKTITGAGRFGAMESGMKEILLAEFDLFKKFLAKQ